MKKIMTAGLIAIFLLFGCAGVENKEEKTAEQLINEGMAQFNKAKYKKSIALFQQLKDWHPLSKYAILAELKSADANFFLEAYDEAIIAYEEFEELHPNNEAIPYVIYQIGLCHFERMDSLDRDQSAARSALKSFQKVQQQHPKNPYAKRAQALINNCNEALAGHEMYVGMFYYKSKYYEAALNRFNRLLIDFPNVGISTKVREYIRHCENKLEK